MGGVYRVRPESPPVLNSPTFTDALPLPLSFSLLSLPHSHTRSGRHGMPTPPQRPLPRPAKNPAAPLPHLFPLEGMTPGLPHEPLPHLAMAPVPALPSTNFSSEDFEPLECSWTFDEASRYTLRSGRCPTRTLLPCCPPHCSTHLIVLGRSLSFVE
jgi:hypothetical protein